MASNRSAGGVQSETGVSAQPLGSTRERAEIAFPLNSNLEKLLANRFLKRKRAARGYRFAHRLEGRRAGAFRLKSGAITGPRM
jgi:hypothetical protein